MSEPNEELVLPHDEYIEANNVDVNTLPDNIKDLINGVWAAVDNYEETNTDKDLNICIKKSEAVKKKIDLFLNPKVKKAIKRNKPVSQDEPPVETPPAEEPPVETPPTEEPPVETPPAEEPPVETPPTESEEEDTGWGGLGGLHKEY